MDPALLITAIGVGVIVTAFAGLWYLLLEAAAGREDDPQSDEKNIGGV